MKQVIFYCSDFWWIGGSAEAINRALTLFTNLDNYTYLSLRTTPSIQAPNSTTQDMSVEKLLRIIQMEVFKQTTTINQWFQNDAVSV